MSQPLPPVNLQPPSSVSQAKWLIAVSVVIPGNSAVIGDPALFWAIHLTALIVLLASILSSIAVLAHILDVPLPNFLYVFGGGLFRKLPPRSSSKHDPPGGRRQQTAAQSTSVGARSTEPSTLDFPSRVSMYIAFIDLFWCSARFADHVYHVATLRIPSLVASEVIGFVVHILFGYHQLLSTCLSLYAYARVVKEKPVKLGSFDWKLHACSLGPSALVAVVFALIGGFGPNAFWSLANARTTSGVAVSFTAFFISLVNALVTTGCRFLISAKLDAALSAIASDVSSTDITTSSYSSSGVSRCEVQIGQVASACIANQTRVASWTYIPLALATYALAMFHAQGYIEPLASLCTTVCANVMGFANAYAYFTNESMKLELRRQVRARSRSRTVRTRS